MSKANMVIDGELIEAARRSVSDLAGFLELFDEYEDANECIDDEDDDEGYSEHAASVKLLNDFINLVEKECVNKDWR